MIELSIAESWAAIPVFEKIFWYVALPFSLFGFISVISAIFGLAGDGADIDIPDGDIDVSSAAEAMDGAGFMQYFSIRNMIMFFAVFGWVGIVCSRAGWAKFATVSVALVSAIIAASLFALLFRSLYKLSESGTITSLESTLGKVGKVYLPIPGERGGTGKIQIVVHSSLRELDAITDGEDLGTSVQVKVKDVLNDSTLIVEKAT